MDEEEKGLVTLYAEGEPVFSGRPVEPPTIELAEVPELPPGGDVMDWNKPVMLEGAIDAVGTITKAWDTIMGTFREAVDTITELWRAIATESVKEWMEKKAIAWADQNRRDLAGRYHHTKKRRIRKKYQKRIMQEYMKGEDGG